MAVARPSLRQAIPLLGLRYWLAALAGTLFTAVAIGVPTDVLPNPWFIRMTPVRPLDEVLWPVTSILVGLLLATYASPIFASHRPAKTGVGLASGTLGWLAIGCPVCNKIVVALIGVSGALTWFAPLQPILGVLGVALAATGLAIRARVLLRGCPIA